MKRKRSALIWLAVLVLIASFFFLNFDGITEPPPSRSHSLTPSLAHHGVRPQLAVFPLAGDMLLGNPYQSRGESAILSLADYPVALIALAVSSVLLLVALFLRIRERRDKPVASTGGSFSAGLNPDPNIGPPPLSQYQAGSSGRAPEVRGEAFLGVRKSPDGTANDQVTDVDPDRDAGVTLQHAVASEARSNAHDNQTHYHKEAGIMEGHDPAREIRKQYGLVPTVIGLAGILLMILPGLLGSWSFWMDFLLKIVGLLLVGAAIYVQLYIKFYLVAQSNEAIVRTGGFGPQNGAEPCVSIGSGLWCIPIIHGYQRFRFRQWVFAVSKKNSEALLCNDCILANISATFKVSVPQTREAVLRFLAAAGERAARDSEAVIKELCLDTLETSLRDACTSKPYQKVFEGREEVASEIEKSVADDFSKSGLQLDSAKLTEVDPTSIEIYNQSNPQHARGLTTIVQMTEEQKLATVKKRLETSEAIREQEVAAAKRLLELDRMEEFAKSAQQKEVAVHKALDSKATQENEIAAAEDVERRQLAKTKAIELMNIQKEQELEAARFEKGHAIMVSELAGKRQIDEAEHGREMELAQLAIARAQAEEQVYRSQALTEQAKQEVQTVAALAQAERDKQTAVIGHQAEADKMRIGERVKADARAYAIQRDAQAKQEAADADSKTTLQVAEAEANAAKLRAEAQRLELTIPIELKKEEALAEKAALEVRSQFAEAGIDLDLKKLQLEKNSEVLVALAKSIGELSGNARLNLYGGPEMLDSVLGGLVKSFGISAFIQGMSDNGHSDLTALTGSKDSSNLASVIAAASQAVLAQDGDSSQTKAVTTNDSRTARSEVEG